MGQRSYIDPFGAPEFLVEAVAYRELVGTEMIKLGWCASEAGECILRFRAIIPVTAILREHEMTRAFLSPKMRRAM